MIVLSFLALLSFLLLFLVAIVFLLCNLLLSFGADCKLVC